MKLNFALHIGVHHKTLASWRASATNHTHTGQSARQTRPKPSTGRVYLRGRVLRPDLTAQNLAHAPPSPAAATNDMAAALLLRGLRSSASRARPADPAGRRVSPGRPLEKLAREVPSSQAGPEFPFPSFWAALSRPAEGLAFRGPTPIRV